MKFKFKLLLATLGLTILLVTTETAIKFMSDYRFVGFERKQDSWYGIAGKAQAEKLSCLQELEQVKADKQVCIDAINPDLK